MSLSIGYVGAGNIGRAHMSASKEIGIKLAGVYDIKRSASEAAVTDHKVAKIYDSLEALVSAPEIDAVIIGTPNKYHAEQTITALNAGKHVLLEKPMAMSVAECDAIIAAKNKAGKQVQIGMVNRFKNSSQALKRIIEAGDCGPIYSGQTFWYRRRGIPGFGSWFTTKEQSGGGGLIDIGVHMLDLALYLMGFPKPVAVSGMTYNNWRDLNSYVYTGMWASPVPNGKKDVDDYAVALVRFDNGATLNVNVSWALNIADMSPEMGLRLFGEKGGVALEGMDHPYFYGEMTGRIVDSKLKVAGNNPMAEEQRAFVQAVTENTIPIATAEQGRVVQSILVAIYKSGTENREVQIP